MKILVLGAGAIGGYYGARLVQAGAAVSFLVRPARAAQLAAGGLVVQADSAPFHGPVQTATSAAPVRDVDAVLLACKAYDLDSAMTAIAPAVEGGAVVLPLLNGLRAYDRLVARFGRDAVLGGVAYIAVSLNAAGEVVQAGATDSLVIGARSPAQHDLATRLHALFAAGPGQRALSPSIDQALWDKWVMLASGAAMTCLMRGSVGEIMHTDHGPALMRQMLSECLAVAAASGHALSQASIGQIEARLLDAASPWSASMMRDIAQRAPRIEADDIVGDMLRRALGFGQAAPLLRLAFSHLQVYESQQAAAS